MDDKAASDTIEDVLAGTVEASVDDVVGGSKPEGRDCQKSSKSLI